MYVYSIILYYTKYYYLILYIVYTTMSYIIGRYTSIVVGSRYIPTYFILPWPGKKISKMRSCHIHNILFCRSGKRVSWWMYIISIMHVGVILLFWGSYRLNTSRFIRYPLFLYYLHIYV